MVLVKDHSWNHMVSRIFTESCKYHAESNMALSASLCVAL